MIKMIERRRFLNKSSNLKSNEKSNPQKIRNLKDQIQYLMKLLKLLNHLLTLLSRIVTQQKRPEKSPELKQVKYKIL